MATLLLGPILRYVDEDSATVWVETDAPASVEVLGHRADTFRVGRHHYALVVVAGLQPGRVYPYQLALDGDVVWPRPDAELPDPVIRTRGGSDARVVFGSCRVAAPDRPPWNLSPRQDRRGRGHDALLAYGRRMLDLGHEAWPDLLLMLGDQVYADNASPRAREFIRARRDTAQPPGEEVADFEEYTRLYREAWGQRELLRWVMASVPSAMIFDDHDVIDDWNISRSWLEDMRATDWWDERIVSGLASYWCYQHLGNVSPAELADDELWSRVRELDDAGPLLREVAFEADRDPASFRWSYDRVLGSTHLVVVDSRAGRTFGDGRGMLDETEWTWLEDRLAEPCEHLLLASSLPVLLPRSVHHAEAWNEAVCAGAWGRAAARSGEALRRAVDLEHWSAFGDSFARLARLLHETAARPGGPGSITILSGDVHHGYLARAAWPGEDHSPVWQAVASPMRNAVDRVSRHGFTVADTGRWTVPTSRLARMAGVQPPEINWKVTHGPVFDNHIATMELTGDRAEVSIETVVGDPRSPEPPALELALRQRLAGA